MFGDFRYRDHVHWYVGVQYLEVDILLMRPFIEAAKRMLRADEFVSTGYDGVSCHWDLCEPNEAAAQKRAKSLCLLAEQFGLAERLKVETWG